MFLLRKLKNLLRKPFKQLRVNDKQKIIEAFTYRGRTYYMFDNIFEIPSIRGLMALDYYEEFEMRCTKEYLQKFTQAMEVILSDTKKLNLIHLATLVKHLQERLVMIPVPDHILKLASVIFFDDSENPYYYDRAYCQKKISLWKQDPEVLSFFFANAIERLNTLFGFARNKFTYVFGGGSGIKRSTHERSFKTFVAEGHDNRYVELVWCAEENPMTITHMERMPIVDYWHLLNRRYEAAARARNKPAKATRSARNSR